MISKKLGLWQSNKLGMLMIKNGNKWSKKTKNMFMLYKHLENNNSNYHERYMRPPELETRKDNLLPNKVNIGKLENKRINSKLNRNRKNVQRNTITKIQNDIR